MYTIGDIGAERFIQERCARLHSALDIDSRRQWFVIDVDQVDGIACGVSVFRDDHGDGFAEKAHLAFCQSTADSHALGNMPKGIGSVIVADLSLEVLRSIDGYHNRVLSRSIGIDAV